MADLKHRFRYFTLVPTVERGSPMELQGSADRSDTWRIVPQATLTSFDAWLLRTPFEPLIAHEYGAPDVALEYLQTGEIELRAFTPRLTTRSIEEARQAFDDPSGALAERIDSGVGPKIDAFAEIAEAAMRLEAHREASVLEGLVALRELLATHAPRIFSTIWYDDVLALEASAVAREQGADEADYWNVTMPPNGRLMLDLPAAIRGAKRPAPAYVDASRTFDLVAFVETHRRTINTQTPDDALLRTVHRTLTMGELLSQIWAGVVAYLSRGVDSITGWSPGWADRLVNERLA